MAKRAQTTKAPKADKPAVQKSSGFEGLHAWLLEGCAGAVPYVPGADYEPGPVWECHRDGLYYHPDVDGGKTANEALAIQREWMQPGLAMRMKRESLAWRAWVASVVPQPPPERIKRRPIFRPDFIDPEETDGDHDHPHLRLVPPPES